MRASGRVAARAAAALALLASAAQAGTVVYTEANAPAAPRVEDLELVERVTKDGITWFFEKPARVGTFVNGDWYVVGAVTVRSVYPRTLTDADVPREEIDRHEARRINTIRAVRNGSMLNPPAARAVAFDSGIRNWFRREGLATYPLRMRPGDSLVSTISLKAGERAVFPYHSAGLRDEHDNCPVKVAAVLTCVTAPQPADAFRPGFCDRSRNIYLARGLRRELLPRLERVEGAPDPVVFAEVFRKPWVNLGFFGFDQPMENMPHYGQWVGQAVGNAALLLCLDYSAEEKERLLINFVQVGIDYWSLVKSGHPGWEGWGGHGSGRKLPIVFAGHLLGDGRMAAPTKTFPAVLFGEDTQTRYGRSWTGANVVFAGHSGVQHGVATQKARGPYEHLHPSQWDRNGQTNFVSEAYRRANTSCCWVAEGLALRLLGLEKEWAHDAFLYYVDRWMTEDDAEHRKEMAPFASAGTAASLLDPARVWFHQGYAGEDWVKAAWERHRYGPAMPPADGWKADHGEEAAMLGPDAATTPRGGKTGPPPPFRMVADPGAAGRGFLDCDLGGGVALKLVRVPAGSFLMGSPTSEEDRRADEEPRRRVRISRPFFLGVAEVTQEQYAAVMGGNPSQFKNPKNPVEQVSWDDAVEFCRLLSAQTGLRARLPTEAEWEYACRAGTRSPFGTGATITGETANCDGTQPYGKGPAARFLRRTTPAGSFAPNGFGLYDMHGNVWEWCADWYAPAYGGPATDPRGPASGTHRVLRGGGWYDGPRDCRSASRYFLAPGEKLADFGFRVVIDAE